MYSGEKELVNHTTYGIDCANASCGRTTRNGMKCTCGTISVSCQGTTSDGYSCNESVEKGGTCGTCDTKS